MVDGRFFVRINEEVVLSERTPASCHMRSCSYD
jgi:hypothetical protein